MAKLVYLNVFIKQFRTLFNDDSLSVSDLHTILQLCRITPVKDNRYNYQQINLLLQGYVISNNIGMEVSRKDVINSYNKVKNSKVNHNYDFLKQQPLEKFPSVPPTYTKQKEDDGLVWKDGGEDMKQCDKILQQKYQTENIKNNKIIIITNNQRQRLIENIGLEGVEYKKNDNGTINVSVNSNTDDKSNAEVDTRIFGKKSNVMNGDGTLSGHYKSFNNTYQDRGNLLNFFQNTLQWVQNKMNGEIPKCGNNVSYRNIENFINSGNIDGLIEWLNKKIETYSQDYEMLRGKYNRLSQYNDDDNVLRYTTGKINGTNVDVIALFTFNDFNFSDAIKHGNFRQNQLTDKLLGITKNDRVTQAKIGRKGKESTERIPATYDNKFTPNIKGNFSLDGVKSGHYKTQYGYNGEGGYNTVRQFIDKSIMYASYALKNEGFSPDYIICAPSSSEFNALYCKTLSRKIGVPFINNFFKRNLLNISLGENVEEQMIKDGLTEFDIQAVKHGVTKAIYREIASEVSKPLDILFTKYNAFFSNISLAKFSREKVDINIIKDVFYKWAYNSLVNTKVNFKAKGGNIYKSVVKNMINGTSNITNSKFDVKHIEHEIITNIKLHIGIKTIESVISQVDSLLMKYANILNQGTNFDLRGERFKITDLDKRYRKYVTNVYIITDKVLNNDGNLFTRYLNSKFLIFDEDMNSGATLRLVIEALQLKLGENNQNNIKCLVNAYSNKGR